MASIELDPQSKRYRLRFRFAGREYKRSLKTTSKRDALAAQIRFEETLRLLETGRLTIKSDTDPISFLLCEGREKTNTTQRVPTLGELIDSYQESIPCGAKEQSTLYTESIHFGHLKRVMGTRQPVESISVAIVQTYVNKRLREKRYGRRIRSDTIKKEIATLRVAWNWGVDDGIIGKPFPSRGLSFPKRAEKHPFSTYDEILRTLDRGDLSAAETGELWESLYLRRDEIDWLIQHLRDKCSQRFVLPMVLMAAHTGARRSELLRCRIEDFDLEAGLVRIREKKRSRKQSLTFRYIPLSDELHSTVVDWIDKNKGGQTFFELNDKTPVNKNTARYWFNRSIVDSRWSKLKGFHILRHSFASNLAVAGVDQRLIDEWMGHQTEEMQRRYRHLFPEHQRSVLNSVFGASRDDAHRKLPADRG